MNCQECRSLVERFLDHALTGGTKRKVNLHLSRCANCRTYFDRRSENQALAYHALNAALADKRLPEGFAKRFREAHIVPERRFRLFRFTRPWKVAAVWVAMVSLIGFAAVVVGVGNVKWRMENEELRMENEELADGTTGTNETTATADAVPEVSFVPEVPVVPEASSSPLSSSTQQGETTTMNKLKAATAALSAAMAAAPLAATNGDEYQFIISGDPVAASTEGSSSASSSTGPLTGGPLADGTVFAPSLEARYCTVDDSPARRLRSDKFKTLMISFK